MKEFLCGSTVEEDLTGEIVRNDGFNGFEGESSKISSEREVYLIDHPGIYFFFIQQFGRSY